MKVKKGETLMTGFTNNESAIETAANVLNEAFSIASEKPKPSPMIIHQVDKEGVHEISN
jgi:hypothetical protein